MSDSREVLDRVTRVPGVRGALLIAATDGLVVAEQLMDDVDGRAAAAWPAASWAGWCAPHNRRPSAAVVHASARRPGSVLAAPGHDDLVLVAVVGPDANVGMARLEMIDAAGRLG